MEIKTITQPEKHYLYIEREVPMNEMGRAMGEMIGALFGFLGQNGIAPQGMPMSIYPTMPDEKVTFRTAVFVSAGDAAKAAGDVKADTMPAGDVVTATHVGPYDKLGQSHKAVWDHMAAAGQTGGAMWEIYLDDPQKTPPDQLKTDVFRAVV